MHYQRHRDIIFVFDILIEMFKELSFRNTSLFCSCSLRKSYALKAKILPMLLYSWLPLLFWLLYLPFQNLFTK